MRAFWIAVMTSLFLGVLSIAIAQEGPKPGPEHKRLQYFAGTWDFKGESKASPMGPGGPITFKETCEWFEGGFALVCRAEGKSPEGPTKSLGIMTYDDAKKAYTYYAVEKNTPAFMATGKVDGGTWSYSTEAKMGPATMTTRVTIKEVSPTSYEFHMEVSTNGGAFTPVMDGKSTKSGT